MLATAEPVQGGGGLDVGRWTFAVNGPASLCAWRNTRRLRSRNCRHLFLSASSPARPARVLERRLRTVDLAGLHGCRPQLERRPLAAAQSVFLGLQQSGRRISVRNVFRFCERGGRSDLEIFTDFSATSCGAFHYSPFRARGRCVLTRARSQSIYSVGDLRCADCGVERLDYLLGRDRLVWRAGRVRLVSVGLVGIGTRALECADMSALSKRRRVAALQDTS